VTRGLTLAGLYFAELSPPYFIQGGLAGPLVARSSVLLEACNTDWMKWNKQPEYAKTAMVLRSEREAKPAGAVLIETKWGNGRLLVTTLPAWSSQYKIQVAIRTILGNLGITLAKEVDLGQPFLTTGELIRTLAVGSFPATGAEENPVDPTAKDTIKENDRAGNLRWTSLNADGGKFDLSKPPFAAADGAGMEYLSFWVESPRSLDNLLLEPNVPKVNLEMKTTDGVELYLNGNSVYQQKPGMGVGAASGLPLQQGWNHFIVRLNHVGGENSFGARLVSSDAAFFSQLKSALQKP
jgi:beta-galactosidase